MAELGSDDAQHAASPPIDGRIVGDGLRAVIATSSRGNDTV
jgi:hypothetical protein